MHTQRYLVILLNHDAFYLSVRNFKSTNFVIFCLHFKPFKCVVVNHDAGLLCEYLSSAMTLKGGIKMQLCFILLFLSLIDKLFKQIFKKLFPSKYLVSTDDVIINIITHRVRVKWTMLRTEF